MNIGDLCRRQLVTCSPETSLGEAARLMRNQHVGTVIVCESRRPVGIVTDRDIVLEVVAADLDARTVKVGEVMSRNPVTALEDDDVSWALKVMRDCGIRRLPVLKASGEVAGIIALDDLLASAATSLTDVVQAIGTGRVVEAERRRVPA